MNKPRFQFSQVVVVEKELIGVVLKTWEDTKHYTFTYDIYVREFNSIRGYKENEIRAFIYSKELSKEELDFY